MPVAHGKTDCIPGEVMGVTEGSTELDGLAKAESPSTRETQEESRTVEMVHIVPSCTADPEDLIEEINLSKPSAADLLDDAEISALLDLEEESDDYQSDEEDIKMVATTHPSSQAHFSSDTDSVDLIGADFGVNDNQSWDIRYHAERQRREEVDGQLAYILSELDKLCGLDQSPELS